MNPKIKSVSILYFKPFESQVKGKPSADKIF